MSEHAIYLPIPNIPFFTQTISVSCQYIVNFGAFSLLNPTSQLLTEVHVNTLLSLIVILFSHDQSLYIYTGCRSKLQRVGQNEEQLLNCANSEESLLDKLPCLCRTVAPDIWGDCAALLNRLGTVIWEEQRKIVWVEPDL